MRIEDEIKQSAFQNDYQKALINIFYTNNFLVDQLNDVFKKHDITRQQYNVLRILRGQYPKPTQIGLIRERMLDKMSDASRIVDRLIKKELIKKNIAEHDRRAVDILISDRGLALLRAIDTFSSDFETALRNLDSGEAAELNRLLDKIRTN
ncbi:MAG: MarR family transcriptional regulator [Cyclobacteriaceae bacterium]|nr:MarR family transcriptional regulator [Cyclobacteriaceae bacterium]